VKLDNDSQVRNIPLPPPRPEATGRVHRDDLRRGRVAARQHAAATDASCGQLRLAGVVAEDVIAEDFGWCVPVKSPPSCANDEGADHWQIFTFVERRLMDRIFGKDKSTELLAPLHAIVRLP
jgi:hypothetical protein